MPDEDSSDNKYPLDDDLVFHGRWVLALLCVAAGIARAFWPKGIDWQTLLFFTVAGALLMLPYLKELSFSGKGGKLVFGNRKDREAVSRFGLGGRRRAEEGTTSKSASLLRATMVTDDPQNGQWGGLEKQHGYGISARIKRIPKSPSWFRVSLQVAELPDLSDSMPHGEKVRFHLHPSFRREKATVPILHGSAELELVSWGAFTVGAEVFDKAGQTIVTLELDLTRVPGVPEEFKNN